MVKIKILEKNDDNIKFLIEGVNHSYVNALRRTVLENVETLAIEDIYIYENSSTMFDEFIGHRIGLLPLKIGKKGIGKDDRVTLMLDQEGPCTVYARDIQSTDPNIEIKTPNVPIMKLKEGQRLRLELKAVVGSGSTHAKWQPATVGYQNVGIVKVDDYCTGCEECVKACPHAVLGMKNKKAVMVDPEKCTVCGECKAICPENSIDIELKEDAFIFFIETHGQLEPKDILLKANDILKTRVEEFKDLSKKLK